MNLFGKKKETVAPTPAPAPAPAAGGASAISKVRDMIEMIEKREQHLERKVKDETAKAIQLSKQNKKREALTCIKRKKMYEKQLDQLSNTKMTLESQQLSLESMNINREAIETTKVANGAMQQNIKAMGGVDAVAETMDAVEEGMQDADEIQTELSRVIAVPGLDDDDELLAELERLEADELASEMSSIGTGSAAPTAAASAALNDMPAVPVSLPAAPTTTAMTEEERELAELEASMAT